MEVDLHDWQSEKMLSEQPVSPKPSPCNWRRKTACSDHGARCSNETLDTGTQRRHMRGAILQNPRKSVWFGERYFGLESYLPDHPPSTPAAPRAGSAAVVAIARLAQPAAKSFCEGERADEHQQDDRRNGQVHRQAPTPRPVTQGLSFSRHVR